MGFKNIPAKLIAKCDACPREVESMLGKGMAHVRPTGWSFLRHEMAGQDWQGAEVADASTAMLLCPKCTSRAIDMMTELRRHEVQVERP